MAERLPAASPVDARRARARRTAWAVAGIAVLVYATFLTLAVLSK